jgi:hypothetical protein
MDAQTQQALRDYQSKNKLPVTGTVDQATAESLDVVIVIVTKVKISLKDLGSGALPRVPRPEDLSCDLVWIRSRDRFELLQPTREAICQVEITELIRCDPV